MKLGPDFDALMARFAPDPQSKIAIAVSGGGDSVALLRLTHEWAQRTSRSLLVFIVDHGLRAEAQAEAEWVAELCARLNVPHKTLTWENPRVSQSAARRARYELICGEMRAHSAKVLLVGHSIDDVLETALTRRRRRVRDASIVGPVLASPAPVWPSGRDLVLVRPLVFTPRAAIRSYLHDLQQSWLEDPSNQNDDFERVRIRRSLDRHPRLKNQALNQVTRLQAERFHQDATFGARLSNVQVGADGLIELANEAASDRMLAILARCASGSDRDPRAEAVRQLRDTLHSSGDRQTLGGAWFQRTQAGYLIGRDPGEAKPNCFGTLFDGRFRRSRETRLPAKKDQAFLVRESAPPTDDWTEIISERLRHLALCYQTPRLNPVQT